MIIHPIPPLFDQQSKVLILGSFPSVKSREAGFFYGHPQNRFWKVIANIFEEDTPYDQRKRRFILRNHLALRDLARLTEAWRCVRSLSFHTGLESEKC